VTRDTRRVEIRDAGVDDVRESIPEGVRKAFVSQACSTDSLRHRMEANVFLVATHDGSVVGFADFRSLSTTEAELAAIYVLPELDFSHYAA
jgi:N-acetylglutamate synthase-like GNAT family acetyltransferase